MEKNPMQSRGFTLNAESGDTDGILTFYPVVWGSVDSYGTRFVRGAFEKTIRQRIPTGGVKVLWQHDPTEPIGLVRSAIEDEHGLLVTAKLDKGVLRADQAISQITSGTLNRASFGFDILNHRTGKDGVQEITEVRLMEVSPVTFAANENTSFVSLRAEDFGETVDDLDKGMRGGLLMDALDWSLYDIRFGDSQDKIPLAEAAIQAFGAAYLDWLGSIDSAGQLRGSGPVGEVFQEMLEGTTLEKASEKVGLTKREFHAAHTGGDLNPEKLKSLAERNPKIAHAIEEAARLDREKLISSARAGTFSPAEKSRLRNLLGEDEFVSGLIDFKNKVRQYSEQRVGA